jgi:hypothetical protein
MRMIIINCTGWKITYLFFIMAYQMASDYTVYVIASCQQAVSATLKPSSVCGRIFPTENCSK